MSIAQHTSSNARNKKIKLNDSETEDITAREVLEYLQQNNTINIEKIKNKIKNENDNKKNLKYNTTSTDKHNNNTNNIGQQINQKKDIINEQKEEKNGEEKEKYITIKFEGENLKAFKHYFKLSQEIERCQKQTHIKSAYINQHYQLIIKVTKENKETITKNWPSDAFNTGIKIIEITKKYHAVIYHVDIDLDVNDTSLMNTLKSKYNITNATRIFKKSSNEPLQTVKITFNNESKYKYHLEHGIQIGYTHFNVKTWDTDKSIKQCYKCLKLGHLQYSCKTKEVKCLRCSETHKEKYYEFKRLLRCANCEGNHAACSKKCPKIIEYMEKNKEEIRKTTTQTNTKEQTIITTNNIITTQIQQLTMVQNLINRSNMTTISFIVEILSRLNEVTESIYEDHTILKNIAKKYYGNQIEKHLEKCLDEYKYQDNSDEDNMSQYNDRTMNENKDEYYNNHTPSTKNIEDNDD